jgi:hypothetical protein
MLKFEVRATFELQGVAGATKMRLILTEDCFQKAQILLGDQWHTLSLEEGEFYIRMYEQLCAFDRHGVTSYVHAKAQGPVGRIATMIDGTERRFWVDAPRKPDLIWRDATDAESDEMDAYRKRIAALQCGASVMFWEESAVTGDSGWRRGVYHYPSLGRHKVQANDGPLNVNGASKLVSLVMTMDDARIEGVPGAFAAAA